MRSLFFLIGLCVLTSAVFANNVVPESLIGRWLYNGETGVFPNMLTFNVDGSFENFGEIGQSGPQHKSVVCVGKYTGRIDLVDQSVPNQITLQGTAIVSDVLYPAPGTSIQECLALQKNYSKPIPYSLILSHFNGSFGNESFQYDDLTFRRVRI